MPSTPIRSIPLTTRRVIDDDTQHELLAVIVAEERRHHFLRAAGLECNNLTHEMLFDLLLETMGHAELNALDLKTANRVGHEDAYAAALEALSDTAIRDTLDAATIDQLLITLKRLYADALTKLAAITAKEST